MRPVYIATAYLGPIQQYCKMLQYPEVRIETAENYVKQTYRNRCSIAAANGPLSLSIPIVKPDTLKCQTKDIRISDHGNWRHLHWNALVSAYNMSPFFEYYADDFAPFYEKKYEFLLDFNETRGGRSRLPPGTLLSSIPGEIRIPPQSEYSGFAVQYGPRRTRYVTGIDYRISLIACIKASISFGKISPILPIRNVSASEILPG